MLVEARISSPPDDFIAGVGDRQANLPIKLKVAGHAKLKKLIHIAPLRKTVKKIDVLVMNMSPKLLPPFQLEDKKIGRHNFLYTYIHH